MNQTSPLDALPEKRTGRLGGLLWSHGATLAGCAALLFFVARPGMAFMGWIFAFCFIPWGLYNAARMVDKEAERKARGFKFSLWCAAILICVVAHLYYVGDARRQADVVVAQVMQYHARTGAWPARLEDIGLDSKEAARPYDLLYFTRAGGAEPNIMYRSTHVVFDRWTYNFKAGAWSFRPD